MYSIKIDGKTFFAEHGEKLSDILIRNNIRQAHPCGCKGSCKKCTVIVNGKNELSCQYNITSDIEVFLSNESDILSVTGAEETGFVTENMCFVLDIGTTTLAMALLSLDEKKIVKVITRTNPQRIYGSDIMSRINYCTENGVSEMQKILLDEIKKMINAFPVSGIEKMYVSGNTTMLHIFAGVNPASMGVAPYTPVFLENKVIRTDMIEEAMLLPSISAFIGADLVAGLNFAEIPSEGKYNLLLDLGTNAEIILFSKSRIITTSAAAGPCFEGANITCGMSATDGAVYSYKKGEIKTINHTVPKGICGTGLICIIAELLSDSVIDKTGFMECEEYEIAEDVYITQSDVRQYQLAKSAVYSAVISLIRKADISFDNIEKVFISGGFSHELNIPNAISTGLIPKELKNKCESINNTSLLGTVKYVFEKNDLSVFTENSEYIDLSDDKYFSQIFIDNMNFI